MTHWSYEQQLCRVGVQILLSINLKQLVSTVYLNIIWLRVITWDHIIENSHDVRYFRTFSPSTWHFISLDLLLVSLVTTLRLAVRLFCAWHVNTNRLHNRSIYIRDEPFYIFNHIRASYSSNVAPLNMMHEWIWFEFQISLILNNVQVPLHKWNN